MSFGNWVTLKQIANVGERRPGNVLGCSIFEIDPGGKIKSSFAEKVLDESGAIHGAFTRQQILVAPQLRFSQREQCSEQLPQRVPGTIGDQIQCLLQQAGDLVFGEAKIKHSQACEEVLIEVFGNSVFLHAELDMLAMYLQIGLDDPMMTVEPRSLEQKCVGPQSPFF
jgi:hypothetical protein